MRGNSLYMSPASRPATRPPEMAVIKTRTVRAATDFRKTEREGEDRWVSCARPRVGWERMVLVRKMERPFQSIAV